MAKSINRRKGPDVRIKAIKFSAIVCCAIMFLIFVLISMSKPPAGSYMGKSLGKNWNLELLQYAFFLLFPLLFTGAIGLLINITRHQRETDTYNKPIVFSLIISVIGIIYFAVIF